MKNMFKMAILDQNCSLMKVNFGRFFTDLKIAQKSPFLGRFYFSKKSPSTFKSRPIGEKSPNLVTLVGISSLSVTHEMSVRIARFFLVQTYQNSENVPNYYKIY
jgi:hypothetical protein